MNITLTGNLGSGKTSVCKELEKMGYKIISTGNIFREIAEEKGISVIELNELAKKDRSIDDLIDTRSTKLGKELDNVVFDSRMAWNFVENSFKVFMLVDTKESAKRVFSGEARQSENYNNEEEVYSGLKKRANLERNRYKELYNVDYYDASNYNLIIESTDASPKQIAEEIIRNFKIYQIEPFKSKIELNISSVYPSQSLRDLSGNVLDHYIEFEETNETNCALCKIPVISNNNYICIVDGHHRTFAAANQGKKFVEVYFTNNNSVTCINKDQIFGYEDIGHFMYKNYPDTDKKEPYMLNFSKLEGPSFEKIEEDKEYNL